MAKKFYAVRQGRTPGIYTSWDACRAQVEGFGGASYKGFETRADAERWLSPYSAKTQEAAGEIPERAEDYCFVDGSFNAATGVYGYGGFLVANGERYVLQGSGDDPELASMHNVAGEVAGSMAAMKKAVELGLEKLVIYYDYLGIEMWATGAWKRNRQGTAAYYDYVQSIQGELLLSFVKVKGHSGIAGNEEADRLAKEAVGIGTKNDSRDEK